MRFDAEGRAPARLMQLSPAELEAWLLKRDPTATGAWNEMGSEEYARAFTAAQTAGTDVVDDLYFGLVDVVSRGGTYDDYSKLVTPILKQKGWLGGDDGSIARRVQLIYDMNLRFARAEGRWANYQASKAALPYILAFTVGDERVRHPPKSESDHRAWDGILLPVDHWFWRKWWPPLGFRCRCGTRQLLRSQAARMGGVTPEDEVLERDARLGVPIFATPAQTFDKQLDDMVEATNEDRMPGMPMVNPVETAHRGRQLWDMVAADAALKQIDAVLASLFGLAA